MQKLQNFALLPSLYPHHLPRALLLWPTFAFLLTHEYFIVVLCLSHANAIERTEAADVACVSACGEIFVFVFFWFFLVYFCCNFGRKWVSLRCITYILVYAFTLYLLQRRLNVLWRIVVSLHVCVCMCFNLYLFWIIHYNDGSAHCIQSMHSYTLVCIYAALNVHDLPYTYYLWLALVSPCHIKQANFAATANAAATQLQCALLEMAYNSSLHSCNFKIATL